MFDNPEKLLILLVIALLIFGPSKLAGLGGTIGKTIREFRSAVRGAQDTFAGEMHQASAEFEPVQPALPAPDPLSPQPPVPAAQPETPGWLDPTAASGGGAAPEHAPAGSPGSSAAGPAASADPDRSSLASEPTAEALRKSLSGRG